jgi:hypothetical protein
VGLAPPIDNDKTGKNNAGASHLINVGIEIL